MLRGKGGDRRIGGDGSITITQPWRWTTLEQDAPQKAGAPPFCCVGIEPVLYIAITAAR